MWVWSSDALSLLVSNRPNNWSKLGGSLQLLAIFDTKNESASKDQTDMTTEENQVALFSYPPSTI
jgi:hypothetical protein